MNASLPITRFHVSDLLRAAWPRDTAKHAAIAAGQSHRTAQGWLAERFTPSAATLLRMAERNDTLRAELVRHLTGQTNASMAEGVLPVDGGAFPASEQEARGQSRHLAEAGE